VISEREFPCLRIDASGISARGSFAATQAAVLDPDPALVRELAARLQRTNTGVVAHYYMDPELQGVLHALAWPHVHVSDSLLMADRAVSMAMAGVDALIVLGVDFMSENVRALVSSAVPGRAVRVLRAREAAISCSLAEAAESRAYAAFLHEAARARAPLHVVYINTSLRTKANAAARIPTITCTSSSVVKTVLAAAAERPDLDLYFGPDTYMGENLQRLFTHMSKQSPAEIARLHPAHDEASLRRLLERFHHFEHGNCIVHHMFGSELVCEVAALYEAEPIDVTAHLEVPSEMFELALRASREGRGVVGSTSDILDHVRRRVANARTGTLRFVLGTEAGMVSALVRAVRSLLEEPDHRAVAVEILFPVAREAVTTTSDPIVPVVPGVSGGEGCSTAGGCATCPYMKMNSLEALEDVLDALERRDDGVLAAHEPRSFADERIGSTSVAELGTVPIMHMRDFVRTGRLPEGLLQAIAEHGRERVLAR
jgi:quinolinate synthase